MTNTTKDRLYRVTTFAVCTTVRSFSPPFSETELSYSGLLPTEKWTKNADRSDKVTIRQ